MSGYKVWADDEVLEAGDVNGYLMSQAVPRFTSDAERDAALAPGTTGQLCYVGGTGLQIFDGSAWVTFDPALIASVAGRTGVIVLTKADVGLSNVDNTADADKPVSGVQAAAMDAAVTAGATAAQDALTAAQDAIAAIDAAQDDAIALLAPLDSPTFTGTVAGIDKAMVGLDLVDDTADADKPISSAQATALALKAPLASPVFTTVVDALRYAARVSGGGTTAFYHDQASASGVTLMANVTGEANPRMRLDGSGVHWWGPGGAVAVDTALWRGGVGILATTGLDIHATSAVVPPLTVVQTDGGTQSAALIYNTTNGGVRIGRGGSKTLSIVGADGVTQVFAFDAVSATPVMYFGAAGDGTLYRTTSPSLRLKTNNVFEAVGGLTTAGGLTVAGQTSYLGIGINPIATIPITTSHSNNGIGIYSINTAPGGNNVYGNFHGRSASSLGQALSADVAGDTATRFRLSVAGHMLWGPGGAVAEDTNLYRSAAATLKTDGSFQATRLGVGTTPSGTTALLIQSATAPGVGVAQRVAGDSTDRYQVAADGKISWGPGSGATDVSLYRSAVGTVRTDESLSVGATLRHLGTSLGFFNAAATTKPTVTGSRTDGTALTSLLSALATLGLIVDSTTA